MCNKMIAKLLKMINVVEKLSDKAHEQSTQSTDAMVKAFGENQPTHILKKHIEESQKDGYIARGIDIALKAMRDELSIMQNQSSVNETDQLRKQFIENTRDYGPNNRFMML